MTKKQVRNRYTGAAGITDREATQLKSMWHKLDKLSKKKNLYVQYRRQTLEAMQLIYEILDHSDRL
jgi:hypothetical protein